MELMDTYSPTVQQLRSKNKQLRQRVQELEELLKESYKDADEVLRPRVQELELALAETEALEMSHGERIEKLTSERDELLAALTYVIEDLELRASLKEDEDERGVVDIGDGAYTQAKAAIASVKGSAA